MPGLHSAVLYVSGQQTFLERARWSIFHDLRAILSLSHIQLCCFGVKVTRGHVNEGALLWIKKTLFTKTAAGERVWPAAYQALLDVDE